MEPWEDGGWTTAMWGAQGVEVELVGVARGNGPVDSQHSCSVDSLSHWALALGKGGS